MVEQSIQLTGSGSNPTSSLQLFRVSVVGRSEIKKFTEQYHYSHSINGVQTSFCFALRSSDEKLVGAMLLGKTASRCGKKDRILEIRRLVCIDDTPKNAESFFIGFVLRWLKKYTEIQTVIAYADPDYGHSGGIYKASNFRLSGRAPYDTKILYKGRYYHRRSLNIKHNGVLKDFAIELRRALQSGEAETVRTHGKNRWVYEIKRKNERL